MEEKKKYERPTRALVKAMESEIASLKEQLASAREVTDDYVPVERYNDVLNTVERHMQDKSRLVADCDAWRERYRELQGRVPDVREVERLSKENTCYRQALVNFIAMLRDGRFDPAILQQCGGEADALINSLYKEINAKMPRFTETARMRNEIDRLRNRGLVARILNR